MNIFVLDAHPKKCAQSHCDKHVVKMILEYTMMLAYAQKLCGGTLPKHFKTDTRHVNHPASKWVRESLNNYLWLLMLDTALIQEYRFRYDRDHYFKEYVENHFPDVHRLDLPIFESVTNRPLIMPDEYKVPSNPVLSYRNYYLGNKIGFAKWNRSPTPDWWTISLAMRQA